MTENTNIPVSPTEEQERPPRPNDDRIRLILVISTIIFTLAVIIAFVLTKDIAAIGTTTVVGIAVAAVFGYYFPKNRSRR